MFKPGFRECAITELNSRLQLLLLSSVDGIDQVVLCYEKFWNGELAAFILTNESVIQASIAIDEKGRHVSTQLLPYEEIIYIQETIVDTDLRRQEYHIDLVCKDKTKKLRFSFNNQDEHYHRFANALRHRAFFL